MGRKANKTVRFFSMLLVFTMIIGFLPLKTYAATEKTKASKGAKCYDLSVNETYKKYDITGDKKKDTIEIKAALYSADTPYVKKITVYINNTKALVRKYDSYVMPTIKLIRLKNGKPFLYISALTSYGTYVGGNIYEYKSSKLKSALNLTKRVQTVKSYWDKQRLNESYVGHLSECIEKVSGKSIFIRIKHSEWRFGSGDELYRYDFKNGKLAMYKKFPLRQSKVTIDLEFNKSLNGFEQIWPFKNNYNGVSQGHVIPVKVTSSNKSVATARRDGHIGAGYSLRINAKNKGATMLTIKAADGRTAKLKLVVK